MKNDLIYVFGEITSSAVVTKDEREAWEMYLLSEELSKLSMEQRGARK